MWDQLDKVMSVAGFVLGGVALPLSGWAIRTHFKIGSTERRLDHMEAWRVKKEEADERLERGLQDVRLELIRISTLQGSMNDSIHRIESRMEAKSE